MLPYGVARWALFRLDPERAHAVAAKYLEWVSRRTGARRRLERTHRVDDPRLRVEALGTTFPNPLGVAAGFDKDARMVPALWALGFGHVEVGTVTPEAQPGNPKPRIWRAPDHEALVNALGFPSEGADAAAERLASLQPAGGLGVNVGPNKDRTGPDMPDHVVGALPELARHADYVAVNVSSPNTPGLRRWQTPDGVTDLVATCLSALDDAGTPRPVLVKLHPDADDADLRDQARAAVDAGAAGVIATNTTRQRLPGIDDLDEGGLSGAPLRTRATEVVRVVADALGDDGVVVGVGGVMDADDVLEKLAAGATLVQAYTGFIYRGPTFASDICSELLDRMDDAGVDSLGTLARGRGDDLDRRNS